jgi:hypothetical protein
LSPIHVPRCVTPIEGLPSTEVRFVGCADHGPLSGFLRAGAVVGGEAVERVAESLGHSRTAGPAREQSRREQSGESPQSQSGEVEPDVGFTGADNDLASSR